MTQSAMGGIASLLGIFSSSIAVLGFIGIAIKFIFFAGKEKNTLDYDIRSLSSRVSVLENQVNNLNANFHTQDSRLAKMETQIGDMYDRMRRIEDKLDKALT